MSNSHDMVPGQDKDRSLMELEHRPVELVQLV
jgi:hypothetical protein